MEKVIQRTAVARRRATAKKEKLQQKHLVMDIVNARRARIQGRREILDAIKEEKKIRREKWELGHLSPHYHLSKAGDVYGAWNFERLGQPDVPKAQRIPFWLIRPGDRVCIVHGHPSLKGLIGEVHDIQKPSESVVIKGIPKITVTNPDAHMATEPPTILVDRPIPLRDIRLVYPLEDPGTGVTKDCIIAKLKRKYAYDKDAGRMRWFRFVHPQGHVIPWPSKEPEDHISHASDTLGSVVEQRTYQPTLLGPPMPESIIDELRGKYSVFRERHIDEYIASKTKQDVVEAAVKAHSEALKPSGARNIARQGRPVPGRKGSEKQPEPKLEKSIAKLIGAHMAANGIKFAHALPTRSKNPS